MLAMPPASSRMQPPDSAQRITQIAAWLSGLQMSRSPTICPGWMLGCPIGTGDTRI
ncbi:MAG: Uncharacterised protein [Cyanobium sp. ARS6]|nr:MAG: Uncharacterised protein [Cyanobium sp. ARS6]